MAYYSPFLVGPFAPTVDEVTAFNLPVTGALPPALNGMYVRNGPNPLGLDESTHHWFSGTGMVHGIRLRDGRAQWYRNRWVRSQLLAESFGEPWPYTHIKAASDFGANTHVIRHAGRILATVEGGPLPYLLSDELESLGPYNFHGTLPGGFAGHTKYDCATRELHAIAYYRGSDNVEHLVIGSDGRVSLSTKIPVPGGPMMHDFALTGTYVVLLDLPVTFSIMELLAGHQMPYAWDENRKARLGLLQRAAPQRPVRWFDIESCWVFHTLNAYDDDQGCVVLDACRYAGPFDVASMTGRGPVTLDRWVIDPLGGTVAHHTLDDHIQENPRIDDRLVGRKHRYGYCTVNPAVSRATLARPFGSAPSNRNSLLKHDLSAGTAQCHSFDADAHVGEATFVPGAPEADEDDGYVLALVNNPERGATDLIVLAAQDFQAPPLARVHLPERVPLGFHGNWFSMA